MAYLKSGLSDTAQLAFRQRAVEPVTLATIVLAACVASFDSTMPAAALSPYLLPARLGSLCLSAATQPATSRLNTPIKVGFSQRFTKPAMTSLR